MIRSPRVQIALAALVVLTILAVGTLDPRTTASGPPKPSSTPTPPVYPPSTPRPTMTLEESLRLREEVRQSGRLIAVSGPETMGSTITIAGKRVQLPPDAFVEHYFVSVLCVSGMSCPQTPIYVIRRGNSTISVSIPSGAVVEEKVAPGEGEAFDFLTGVLP